MLQYSANGHTCQPSRDLKCDPGILTCDPRILAMIQGSRSCRNFVMTSLNKYRIHGRVVTMTMDNYKYREEWSQ